jgi:hypothetical protein
MLPSFTMGMEQPWASEGGLLHHHITIYILDPDKVGLMQQLMWLSAKPLFSAICSDMQEVFAASSDNDRVSVVAYSSAQFLLDRSEHLLKFCFHLL